MYKSASSWQLCQWKMWRAHPVTSRQSSLYYSCNSLPQGFFFLASGSRFWAVFTWGMDMAEMPDGQCPASSHQTMMVRELVDKHPSLLTLRERTLKCVLHRLPEFPDGGTYNGDWLDNIPCHNTVPLPPPFPTAAPCDHRPDKLLTCWSQCRFWENLI